MDTTQISILTGAVAFTGFFHTLVGPDHYLPFIVLSKARKWSLIKTALLTIVCGIGHVGSSVLLGFLVYYIGIGLSEIQFLSIEETRGSIAAWGFILFGFAYMTWGFYRAYRNKPHKHIHFHNGKKHVHEHVHSENHDHLHKSEKITNLTPWVLIIIFVLGPCEPLIGYFIYLSKENNLSNLWRVSAVFSIVTILTMLVLVLLFSFGLKQIRFGKLERYMHAIAGATVFLSGCAIVFLGL